MTNLPADEVSEQLVLSTFFHEPDTRKFLPRIFKQIFFNDEHREIFLGLRQLIDRKIPVDVVSLPEVLTGKMLPSRVVEIFLNMNVLTLEQLDWHIKYLKELYFYRVSLNISTKIADAVTKRQIDNIVKLGLAYDKVRDALFRGEREIEDQYRKAVRYINSPLEYIPSSFPSLRKLMGGYTRSQISSIGGKSGHNKTTFAIFEAVEQIKQGLANKVLYVSVDEDGEMVARRVMAGQLGLSLSAMRNKEIQLDEKEVVKAVQQILSGKLIILDDLVTSESIAQAILELKPDRVIVDHIQELNYGTEGISDAKVMVACGRLKQAAKLANANVTIISQVRDKLIDERFDSKVPRPHDFLYASDLRRKSREQCVVYWEFKDTQRDADYAFFDFIVWKSTYSETGRLRFTINPDRAVFSDAIASAKPTETPIMNEGDIWNRLKDI